MSILERLVNTKGGEIVMTKKIVRTFGCVVLAWTMVLTQGFLAGIPLVSNDGVAVALMPDELVEAAAAAAKAAEEAAEAARKAEEAAKNAAVIAEKKAAKAEKKAEKS